MKITQLFKIGAYFLPRDLKLDEESVLFATTVVVGILTMSIFGSQYYYYGVWPLCQRMIESILIMVIALFWLYRRQSLVQSAHIVMLGLFHAVIVSSLWSGGIHGHKIVWIPAVLFLPGFFMSLNWVLVWGGAYALGAIFLMYAEAFGISVSQPFSSEVASSLKLRGVIFAMGTSQWMAWNYRASKDTSLKSLQLQEISLIKVFRELGEAQKKLQSQHDENLNLIRMITHDIANPLMVIQAWQNRIPEGVPAKNRIEKACESMMKTLSFVRDFRALKDGKASLKQDQIDIVRLLQNAAELFEDQLAEKNLKVQCIHKDEMVWVRGDQRIIESQIFSNLLSNAIKFSQPDGFIEIRIEKKGDLAEIVVRDHGIGMPMQVQNDLFQLNKKTSRPGTNGEKGTGFGMPIVKHFIELHGGKISVQSWDIETHPSTSGTEISFSLPLCLNMVGQPKAS